MVMIFALGGGEIGRSKKTGGFYPVETTKIDKEIILASGKKKPKLLFIPTVSSDSEGYFDVVKKHFSKLGCEVDVLYLIKKKLSKKFIEEKILGSDIIYVGGGNTLKMMTIWRREGVDMILKKALSRGIILSGLSAGAICWFRQGQSDSRKFTSSSSKLIKVSGLGFVDALLVPHYNTEINRKNDLKNMMKKTSGVAIALDECCAIQIKTDDFRIVKSKSSAKAFKVFWKKGVFFHEEIKNNAFKSLNSLLVN